MAELHHCAQEDDDEEVGRKNELLPEAGKRAALEEASQGEPAPDAAGSPKLACEVCGQGLHSTEACPVVLAAQGAGGAGQDLAREGEAGQAGDELTPRRADAGTEQRQEVRVLAQPKREQSRRQRRKKTAERQAKMGSIWQCMHCAHCS